MKKGVIIFQGKYGATRQYAKWLSEELDLPFLEPDQVTDQSLSAFDYIVLGSSVYYGKLLLRLFILQHSGILSTKKIFVFIVCATPESDEKTQKSIIKANIPQQIAGASDIFFVAGRLVLKKLSFTDRLMLRMAAIFEQDPVKKQVMQTGIDAVKEENLIDIIIAVTMYALIKPAAHP